MRRPTMPLDVLVSVVTEDKTVISARQLFRKVNELVALIEKISPATYADLWADGAFVDSFDDA